MCSISRELNNPLYKQKTNRRTHHQLADVQSAIAGLKRHLDEVVRGERARQSCVPTSQPGAFLGAPTAESRSGICIAGTVEDKHTDVGQERYALRTPIVDGVIDVHVERQ